jgi:hypothetical protein
MKGEKEKALQFAREGAALWIPDVICSFGGCHGCEHHRG